MDNDYFDNIVMHLAWTPEFYKTVQATYPAEYGGIEFEDFEVPEQITAGGEQAMFVHKYPGGLRTIDSMGPDDADLSWRGWFETGTAEDRCQQLDAMRRQGLQVALTWSSYSYLVVVKKFEWDYKRFFHIGYSITLEVVQDETQPQVAGGVDIDQQIDGDLSDSLIDTGFPGAGAVNAAIGAIQATVSTVQTVTSGTLDFLTGLSTQIAGAAGLAASLQEATDTALSVAGNPALFASGTTPTVMIQNVAALVAQSGAMASIFDAHNKLTRMRKNVAAVGT